MIAVIRKGQLVFLGIAFAIVISSNFLVEKYSQAKTVAVPALGICVVLDAGHGGVDPGGVGIVTKVKESTLNLSIAKKVKGLLEAVGVRVVLTRNDENGLYKIYTKGYKKEDMAKRKEIIQKEQPNAVISIHMNRFRDKTRRGAQAFYDAESDTGKALAQNIQEEFRKQLEASTRDISTGDYFMLKCTDAPSVLVECGYLSNEHDERLLQTKEYQHKVAYCIFCGLVRFLCIVQQTSNFMNHSATMAL